MEVVVQNGPEQRRIAQFAVSARNGEAAFLDTLQVLPPYRHLWAEAMEAALRALGPGLFHYGSDWSLDNVRAPLVDGIPGARVISRRQSWLDVIDFRRWTEWRAYLSAISTNVLRNDRKCAHHHPRLRIETRHGASALTCAPRLNLMRWRMYREKGVAVSPLKLVLRSAARTWCLRQYAMTALAISEAGPLSAYAGIDFGRTSFYLEGASTRNNGGAAWRLLLAMVQAAFERTEGQGLFVLGPSVGSEPPWDGLARSRRQLRATAVEGCCFSFRYESPS